MFFIEDEEGNEIDLYYEEQAKEFNANALLFNDWIKEYDPEKLPPSYEQFLLRDILNISPMEKEQMSYIDSREALNYATITYRLRSMGTTDESKLPSKGKTEQTMKFNQKPDWDHDPDFYSKV